MDHAIRGGRRVPGVPRLGQQRINRDALAVLGHVEWPSFGDIVGVGRNAEGFIDRRVGVFLADGILDRQHRVLVGRLAIDEALLESAAEEGEAVAAAEMAVETVHLLVLDHQVFAGVPLRKPIRFFAGGGRRSNGAPELGGNHHQGPVQQAALVQILDQLRDACRIL